MKRPYPYTGPGAPAVPQQPPGQNQAQADYSNYGYGGAAASAGTAQQQPMTAEEQQAQWHKQWQQYYAQQAAAAAAGAGAGASPVPQHQSPATPHYNQQYPQQAGMQPAAAPYAAQQHYAQSPQPYPHSAYPAYPQNQPPAPHPSAQPRPPFGPQQPYQQQGPYPTASMTGPPSKRTRYDGPPTNHGFGQPQAQTGPYPHQPGPNGHPQQAPPTSYNWPGAPQQPTGPTMGAPVRPAGQPPSGPGRGGRGGGSFASIPARPQTSHPQGHLARGGNRRGGLASNSHPARGGMAAGAVQSNMSPRPGAPFAGPGGPVRGNTPGRGASNAHQGLPRNAGPHSSGARAGFSSQNSIPTGAKNRYNQNQQQVASGIPSGPSASTPTKPGQRSRNATPSAAARSKGASGNAPASTLDQRATTSAKQTFTDLRIVRIDIPDVQWHWDLEEQLAAQEAAEQAEQAALEASVKAESDSEDDEDNDDEDDADDESHQDIKPEDVKTVKEEDNDTKATVPPKAPAADRNRQGHLQRQGKKHRGGATGRVRFCFAAPTPQTPSKASVPLKAEGSESKSAVIAETSQAVVAKESSAAQGAEVTAQAGDGSPAKVESHEETGKPLDGMVEQPSEQADGAIDPAGTAAFLASADANKDTAMAESEVRPPESHDLSTGTGQDEASAAGERKSDADERVEGLIEAQAADRSVAKTDQDTNTTTEASSGEVDNGQDKVAANSDQTGAETEVVEPIADDVGPEAVANPEEAASESADLTQQPESDGEAHNNEDQSEVAPPPPVDWPNRISLTFQSNRQVLHLNAGTLSAVRIHRAERRVEIDVKLSCATQEEYSSSFSLKGVQFESRAHENESFVPLTLRDIIQQSEQDATRDSEPQTDGEEKALVGAVSDSEIKPEAGGEGQEKKEAVDEQAEAKLSADREEQAQAGEIKLPSVPPLHRLQPGDVVQESAHGDAPAQKVVTIALTLEKAAPATEAKWLKTGDVEEWLSSLPGFPSHSPLDLSWHQKIHVVDPDPPPTMQDVFVEWQSKSFMGPAKERKRFVAEYLKTSRGQIEILGRLVRGERAATNPNSREFNSSALSEASKRTAFSSHQTHLSLAVLALFGLAEEFADRAGATSVTFSAEDEETSQEAEGSKKRKRSGPRTGPRLSEFETRIDELLMSMPQNLIFRALDGMWKEVLEKTQREKQQQNKAGGNSQRHKKGKGGGGGGGGSKGNHSANDARSKKEGSVASMSAPPVKGQQSRASEQNTQQSQSKKRRRSTASNHGNTQTTEGSEASAKPASAAASVTAAAATEGAVSSSSGVQDA